MADQAALDKYADEIAGKVTGATINDTTVSDLLFNGRHYAADEVLGYMIKSQVPSENGQEYPLRDFIGSIDRKLSELLAALAAK
jgi:hypothetical protein